MGEKTIMIWHHIVLHATALVVVGFFVAFAAQKASGGLKSLGTFLSYWLYLLAVLVIVLGALFTHRHPGGWMMGHPGPWMMNNPGQLPPPAPSAPAQ